MLTIAVWVARILVGALFVFSGFSKAVDPWGFMYKIEEYLTVWDLAWIPREAVFCVAALISLLEFTAGAMLLLGCLRRVSVWVLTAIMAVLLPLSVYIAIANPVADCGCFGDAYIISNTATLIKNVILVAILIFLMKWNTIADGIITPLLQWIPATACALYCVLLSAIGLGIQPIVDFRPYKIGKPLIAEDSEEDIKIIYSKDGIEKEFDIYDLPDSTWTYIGRKASEDTDKRNLSIYDGDDEVTDAVITTEGPQIILTVSNPRYHSRARASMANRLNEYIHQNGGEMIALVPLKDSTLLKWEKLSTPDYPVYTADMTTIKEMVRGDASLIYLKDGIVQWKRDIYSLPGDFPDFNNPMALDQVTAVDNGYLTKRLTILLLAAIGMSWILGLPAVVKWKLERKKRKAKQKD